MAKRSGRLRSRNIPPILVSDFGQYPPVTVNYIKKFNELDFKAVYRRIRDLTNHPGRGQLDMIPGRVIRFQECDQEFLDAFWRCAGNLSDYFADFLAFDTVIMQSAWFHLLEKLLEATILPHQIWISGLPCCQHSREFLVECSRLRRMLYQVIAPQRKNLSTNLRSSFLGTDWVRANIPMNDGKCGVQSWQQFLYKGSPGFFVPVSERMSRNAGPIPVDYDAFEACIPRGGLALVDSYITKLRRVNRRVETLWTNLLFSEDQTNFDELSNQQRRRLVEFEDKVPKLDRVSAYTAIDGRPIALHPTYPRPNQARVPRYGLASEARTKKPKSYRLNNFAGPRKGKASYEHPDDVHGRFSMLSFGASEPPQNDAQARIDGAAYSDAHNP